MIILILISIILHISYTLFKNQTYEQELFKRLLPDEEQDVESNIPHEKNVIIGDIKFPFILYKNGITLICNTEEQILFCKSKHINYMKMSDFITNLS